MLQGAETSRSAEVKEVQTDSKDIEGVRCAAVHTVPDGEHL